MSLSQEQKLQIILIKNQRDAIIANLNNIEKIIKVYFPEEFNIAYQHWIPQITTALYSDEKWLPRGSQTMEHTLARILDQENNTNQSIRKFL
jgi:enoyl reductase-like protein